jgi:hypothetical protein
VQFNESVLKQESILETSDKPENKISDKSEKNTRKICWA